MWRESDDAQKDNFESIWPQISDELLACDALVVVAPEWHGMVPPALKNFFLHCDGELANKPGLIVGVSAGNGGAYPISELRMSSYKNSRICWIPDHLIVRNVEDVLNDSSELTTASEGKLRQRAMYCVRLLAEYAKGLSLVRSSGVVDLVAHPFGM